MGASLGEQPRREYEAGDANDEREDEDLGQHRERDEIAPEGAGIDGEAEGMNVAVGTGGGLGDGGEIRPEEESDDGGGEGGVGPVIDEPGALLAL